MVQVTNVCFIGAGFVGGPSGAVLALKNPDVQVSVVDLDEERISSWKSDNLPLYEPGLLGVTKECRDGASRPQNLFFTTNVAQAVKDAEVIFVCVNTPTKLVGTGAGRAPNLQYLENATRFIASQADSHKIIVEKSTVPCRTAYAIREILHNTCKPGVTFDVLSNPEFLAEGTAIQDLLSPDRVLVGSLESGEKAAQKLINLYASWIPRERILTLNLWSSELAKLAANALLAQRISSINTLSAICEATGADIGEISHAVGLDSRIGPKMLQASVGFGGSCFKKDVLNLAYMAEALHLPEVASYWQSVVVINEWQKDRFTKRISRCLYNSITNKKIAIFGFAYKKNTSDSRESAAISVVRNLLIEGAHVCIYDPEVSKQHVMAAMGQEPCQGMVKNLSVASDAYKAVDKSHAVVILTEWDEFSNSEYGAKRCDSPQSSAQPATGELQDTIKEPLANMHLGQDYTSRSTERVDWATVYQMMEKPAFVFDGRRIMDNKGLEQLGFKVESIGKNGKAL